MSGWTRKPHTQKIFFQRSGGGKEKGGADRGECDWLAKGALEVAVGRKTLKTLREKKESP